MHNKCGEQNYKRYKRGLESLTLPPKNSHSILKYINRRPQSRMSQGFVPKVHFKTRRAYYPLLLLMCTFILTKTTSNILQRLYQMWTSLLYHQQHLLAREVTQRWDSPFVSNCMYQVHLGISLKGSSALKTFYVWHETAALRVSREVRWWQFR